MHVDYIFVYGTLKRDADTEMSRLLAKQAEFVGIASYQAKLYKIADYPGAIPSDNPNDQVPGEIYRLPESGNVLSILDRYEEFGPEFPEPNEYIRQKQTVLLINGRNIAAWVYIYNHSVDGLTQYH